MILPISSVIDDGDGLLVVGLDVGCVGRVLVGVGPGRSGVREG